jgi:hypothetical protein
LGQDGNGVASRIEQMATGAIECEAYTIAGNDCFCARRKTDGHGILGMWQVEKGKCVCAEPLEHDHSPFEHGVVDGADAAMLGANTERQIAYRTR